MFLQENEKLNQALSVGHVSNTPIAERHALLELQEKYVISKM